MKNKHFIYYCSFFISMTSAAGIMLPDIDVQEYRDFAENLEKYTTDASSVPVFKTDGSLSDYLNFSMPNFGSVISAGYSTLISPSYIVSVKHNSGYKNVTFGNGARFAETYQLISRNNHSSLDFHIPRLNKVVTDAAPVAIVGKSDFLSNYKSRYMWYTRVGAGTQTQVNEEGTERVSLAAAYKWKTGGTISTENVRSLSSGGYLKYYNLGPDSVFTTPLSIGTEGGDSGSPVFAWDEVDEQWKLVAVHRGYDQDKGVYQRRAVAVYIPQDFVASTQASHTSADVTDSSKDGTLYWGESTVSQGNTSWSWHGLDEKYRHLAPSEASNDELDASKDLRFNGDGGVIALQDAVNLGAGKLQFSADYTLTSAEGADATWVGGGVEVDAGKDVLWQVNGLAGDALHKIGEGTLHINATGVNAGSLNTGAGTVILDQQADSAGQKQAFSSVTLVSGRPTVILADADQVSSENIRFGYRGGTLDLNGNALRFKKINHTDSGATLVNHHAQSAATLTLTGYSSEDVPFNKWSSSGKGTIGSLYQYSNPYSKQTEYFQLNSTSYGYFPTSQSSTATWTWLGTNASEAVNYRLSQLNNDVFRGFLGERDSNKTNGELNVTVNQQGDSSKMTLSGGFNLNGSLNVSQGTVILSGQPVAQAGGVVVDDNWSTSLFKAHQVVVNSGATFQVGEYADVTADVVAGESSKLMFGYNNSEVQQDKIWRCYAVINTDSVNCSQPARTRQEQSALSYSAVTGDVSLADNASLYLGKVDYQGRITSSGTTALTLDPAAYWRLTGSSSVTTLNALSGSRLSLLSSGKWSAKHLEVDTLNATDMTLSLGVMPSTAENDKLTIRRAATGASNILDVSLMLDASQPVSLLKDLVMVDAPAGTSHSYFTLPDIALGFSLYSPNYQVQENDGRVLWVLQHNNDPTPVPPEDGNASDTDNTPAADDDSASDKDSTPATDDDSASDKDSIPAADDAAAGDNPASAPPEQGGFSPQDWFTINDNQPLIDKTRGLMASRQYLLNEMFSTMHQRSSLLRDLPEKRGEWATLEHHQGSWQDFTLTQQTLSLGWDTVFNQQTVGISASHSRGKSKGNGRATHYMSGVGISYSWSSPVGWFIDSASRYTWLKQEFSFDPLPGINEASPSSHIIAASIKSGYEFTAWQNSLSVSPYIGLSGAYLSGYSLRGENADIALSSSTPWQMTSGVELKKRGLWSGIPHLVLSAGIEYQYAPARAGSTLNLSDSHSHRQYDALSDNRYRLHAGIEGKPGKNLSVVVQGKTSFAGNFRTDYSGLAGLTYSF